MGAQSCYSKFVNFVDKSCEMIFSKFFILFIICINIVVGLIAAAVWDSLRTINILGTSDNPDIMSTNKVLNIICVVYYLILASIIFLSWKNNEDVL